MYVPTAEVLLECLLERPEARELRTPRYFPLVIREGLRTVKIVNDGPVGENEPIWRTQDYNDICDLIRQTCAVRICGF